MDIKTHIKSLHNPIFEENFGILAPQKIWQRHAFTPSVSGPPHHDNNSFKYYERTKKLDAPQNFLNPIITIYEGMFTKFIPIVYRFGDDLSPHDWEIWRQSLQFKLEFDTPAPSKKARKWTYPRRGAMFGKFCENLPLLPENVLKINVFLNFF